MCQHESAAVILHICILNKSTSENVLSSVEQRQKIKYLAIYIIPKTELYGLQCIILSTNETPFVGYNPLPINQNAKLDFLFQDASWKCISENTV